MCSTASFELSRGLASAPGPVHCGVPTAGIGAGGDATAEGSSPSAATRVAALTVQSSSQQIISGEPSH